MSTVPFVPPVEPMVSCADACGNKIAAKDVEQWKHLCIQNRYRCWECFNALSALHQIKEPS